jgi:FKBP-type peptidyl-prolyl cis-trans isomerase
MKRNYGIAMALALAACASGTQVVHAPMVEVAGQEHVVEGGLRYVDMREGNGPAAERGECVFAHYTLYRRGGQWLQSSRDTTDGVPGEPASFVLGNGKVIRGWEIGITGMKIGGVRRLFVPDALAYGDKGSPPLIPANAFLVFDIELMSLSESRNALCPSWASIH